MTKAIDAGDRARYRLPAFQRRLAKTLAQVEAVVLTHCVGVSMSTGKDSLVVLDLVRRVKPDAPAAFFDSGAETEHASNYDLVALYGVEQIESQIALADIYRYTGRFGYEHPVDPEAEFDIFSFIVGEPSALFTVAHNLDVIALGLRAAESKGRYLNYKRRGKFYSTHPIIEGQPLYHFCPIADWKDDDVWAYIAGRGLVYNPVYDKMAAAGLPRRAWRVSPLLGEYGAFMGRVGALRMTDPQKFNELAAQFPYLRRLA